MCETARIERCSCSKTQFVFVYSLLLDKRREVVLEQTVVQAGRNLCHSFITKKATTKTEKIKSPCDCCDIAEHHIQNCADRSKNKRTTRKCVSHFILSILVLSCTFSAHRRVFQWVIWPTYRQLGQFSKIFLKYVGYDLKVTTFHQHTGPRKNRRAIAILRSCLASYVSTETTEGIGEQSQLIRKHRLNLEIQHLCVLKWECHAEVQIFVENEMNLTTSVFAPDKKTLVTGWKSDIYITVLGVIDMVGVTQFKWVCLLVCTLTVIFKPELCLTLLHQTAKREVHYLVYSASLFYGLEQKWPAPENDSSKW